MYVRSNAQRMREYGTNGEQYMEFDRWQLLDAFQSLLIYCLLRVQEVPIELEGIEMALLTTVNVSGWQRHTSSMFPVIETDDWNSLSLVRWSRHLGVY